MTSTFLDMTLAGEAYLEHFGRKGMKWGVRNAESSEPSSGGPSKVTPRGGTAKPRAAAASVKAHMDTRKKVAIGVALTAGALAVAAIMHSRGSLSLRPKSGAVNSAEALFGTAKAPSPFQMQLDAGRAAQRNVLSRIGNQHLTDKTWRDAAKMSQMTRAQLGSGSTSVSGGGVTRRLMNARMPKKAVVPDMGDIERRLMAFTDQGLQRGGMK